MITRETIDRVFETARVEEVIGDFVQLKRSGTNYKGLSPFSKERTPSFMVSPVKQIWKDFSSGKGGNAVSFIMEHEQFSYPDAIRYLAKKYNIEIEETEVSDEQKIEAQEKEGLFIISEYAQSFFQQQLSHTDEGKAIGLTYFKERGFTPETIQKFHLGYSPEKRDAFASTAIRQGYQPDLIEKTGLIIGTDNGFIDRFRGRVMFPIHSLSGRVVGFGGRILQTDKKTAKYLNSPESDIYQKSKVLYGIFQAKQAIAKKDNCYLVEGYTDVIQLHQSGIENVVASSGTALTPDQIRLMNRLTKNVTVLFDGDAAGIRASLRGIDLILEEGMNVRVCTFPAGEDPDSFAKSRSYTELQDYLENQASDFIRFKASLLMDEAKQDPIKKAELIHDMVASIAKISDRIQREIYIQECSKIMDISEEVLRNTLAQMAQKELKEADKKFKENRKAGMEVVHAPEQIRHEKIDVLYHLERTIIEILLNSGSLVASFEDITLTPDDEGGFVEKAEWRDYPVHQRLFLSLQEDEIELANEGFRHIYQQLIAMYQQEVPFSQDLFMAQLPQEYASIVSDILMEQEREPLHNWEMKQIPVKKKDDPEVVSQFVTETIVSFREYLLNKVIQELASSLGQIDPELYEETKITISDYIKLNNILKQKISRGRSHFY